MKLTFPKNIRSCLIKGNDLKQLQYFAVCTKTLFPQFPPVSVAPCLGVRRPLWLWLWPRVCVVRWAGGSAVRPTSGRRGSPPRTCSVCPPTARAGPTRRRGVWMVGEPGPSSAEASGSRYYNRVGFYTFQCCQIQNSRSNHTWNCQKDKEINWTGITLSR